MSTVSTAVSKRKNKKIPDPVPRIGNLCCYKGCETERGNLGIVLRGVAGGLLLVLFLQILQVRITELFQRRI